MQSLCNVIKNSYVLTQGNKEIITKTNGYNIAVNVGHKDGLNILIDENYNSQKEQFEILSRNILDTARRKSDEIMAKAYEMVKTVEKEAYTRGYKSGSERGFNDAYEKAVPNAQIEANKIINHANDILFNSKIEYENYMTDKKDEIIKLSMSIAEKILKKELSSAEGLNEVIYEALSQSRNAEVYVIKTNSIHTEELKSKVNTWKENLGLRGDVFIVADETVGAFNALIEKNNGKVIIGLDTGMESIKQALLS